MGSLRTYACTERERFWDLGCPSSRGFLMMNWAVIFCAFITLVVMVPSNSGKHFLIETKEPSYPDYDQEAGSDYCRRFCFGDMNWGVWNSHHENVTEIHNQDQYVGNFESPDLEPARK